MRRGPKRILALDGGGVKCFIEAILKERSGRGDEFRLSDYFDFVGGTSVGVLLATLFARGNPVSQIKAMFNSWTPTIFLVSELGQLSPVCQALGHGVL